MPNVMPPIVTICGSMRFYNEMLYVAERLTLNDQIVLMPFVVKRTADGEHTRAEQERLDWLHKRKIDLSERIVVVSDADGYYGDSTKSEIAYAQNLSKTVDYLKVQIC